MSIVVTANQVRMRFETTIGGKKLFGELTGDPANFKYCLDDGQQPNENTSPPG